MAAERIDSTLIAPVVPRTLVTPARDTSLRQGQGDEVSISREARALQALDTGSNAELYNERAQRPELNSYLATQRSSEGAAASGQIIEGQYQQKALENAGGNSAEVGSRSISVSTASSQGQAALQAYQDAEDPGRQPGRNSIDVLV